MRIRFGDWIWALVAGSTLFGLAIFIVFIIHPGGFEGQVAWFFGLMPGAFLGAALGDKIHEASPILEVIVFWPGVFGITFSWYFGVSYAAIKIYRMATRSSHD